MGYTVTRVTFPLYGQNDGQEITREIFSKGLIPPIINDRYKKTITHHDIGVDPYPKQRKDVIVELTDNTTKKQIKRIFSEPPAEGSDRRIFIDLP